MDGITKLAPIVAFYAGKPEMLEKVEAAVRVTQNNDACVAETLAAARQAGLPINSQTHARGHWHSEAALITSVFEKSKATLKIVDVTSRFLEHFILNGPDPNALDSVISQLNDPQRKQPQDLDKAVIGM